MRIRFFGILCMLISLFCTSSIVHSQTYCDPPLPENPCQYGLIGDFTFANISMPGFSCDTNTQGYSEHLSDTAFLVPNEVYTASLTCASPLLFDIYYLFIDWNLDYEFSEDERVQFAGVNDGLSGPVNVYQAVITVPPTAVTDSVGRLRVFGSWLQDDNLRGCNDNLLDTYLEGEVEDYHFVVTDTPPASSGPYCDADGGMNCSNGTDTTFINAVVCEEDSPTIPVKQEAYNNATGCDSYADYTQYLSLVAKWSIGQSYQVSVSIEDDAVTALAAIYVDLNNDQEFSTEEEFDLLYLAGQPRTALITVPPGSATGTFVRMRVRVNGDLAMSPCGSLDFGEVEDYNVLISPLLSSAALCVEKVNPEPGATNVCSNTTLTWRSDADAEGYLVTLLSESGDVLYQNHNTTDTTLTLPKELDADSTYYWGVAPYTADDTVQGCDIDTFRVAPNLAPKTSILPIPATVCLGENVTLSGNPTEGTISTDYGHSWNGKNNALLSDTAIVNPVYTPTTSGTDTITYTVTDDLGCFNTDSVIVTTTDGPVLDTFYLTASTVCEGADVFMTIKGDFDSFQITDSLAGGTPVAISFVQPNDTTAYFKLSEIGEHHISVSVIKNCEVESNYTQQILIEAAPNKPTISTNATSTLCADEVAQLVTTNYADNVIWNDASSTENDSLLTTESGNYFAVYTDATTGCSSKSDTIDVDFHSALDKPVLSLTDSIGICDGEANEVVALNYNTGIVWNDALATNNDTLSLEEAGIYIATYTDAVTGCSVDSDELEVTQSAQPAQPMVDAPNGTTFCAAKSVLLAANNYTDNIVWSDDLNTVNDTLSVSGAGSYQATYTDPATGCSNTSEAIEITELDTAAIITELATNQLTCDVVGDSYRWFLDGEELSQTTQTIDVTEDGTYTVVVIIDGCESSVSDDFPYIVDGINGVAKLSFHLHPNPSSGKFSLTNLPEGIKQISVFSVTGKQVFNLTSSKVSVDLQLNVTSGLYQVKIQSTHGVAVQSIIID